MFGFFKNKAPKVSRKAHDCIEFTGNNDVLFSKVDAGADLDKLATVIVPPTHTALIIKNGAIDNICSGGEFALYDENGKLKPKNAVRSLKVIYISKTVRLTVRWGTKELQRIEYIDPVINKPVSVGAFGSMEVKVGDPKRFYLDLVASYGDSYSIEDLQERIRTRTVDELLRIVGKVLCMRKMSYMELNANKFSIQEEVENLLDSRLNDSYGLEVYSFVIENFNVTKEQKEEIQSTYVEESDFARDKRKFDRAEEMRELERQARRREMQAQKDDSELDDFLYARARDRRRDEESYERSKLHEDEDRLWAREDKQADREERMHGKYMDTVRDVEESRSKAEVAHAERNASRGMSVGHHCSLCGADYRPGAKYCPSCGATLPSENDVVRCPDCGAESPWGTSFCPSCGAALTRKGR